MSVESFSNQHRRRSRVAASHAPAFADMSCDPVYSAASQPGLGVCSLTPIMLTQRRFLVMMPLYYLHIRNGDKLEVDPDGTELPDLEAAFAEAVKVARELVDEVDDLGRDAAIEITDGAGETVLTVPFSDTLRPH